MNVSDENYKTITTTGAAGVFSPTTNTIIVYYFNPVSNSKKIQKYCNNSNNQRELITRHEMEHARKSDLTHNTKLFSAKSRAQIAAMNEIMAPASEIIEALDYHIRTGMSYPNAKQFITRADSAIFHTAGAFLPRYVNYNHQPIADIIVTYALESFISSVNRGYYKHTIKKAFNTPQTTQIPPINLRNTFTFDLDTDLWAKLWEFESDAGKCNPYIMASWQVRNKLIEKVDSVVHICTNADNFTTYFTKDFSH